MTTSKPHDQQPRDKVLSRLLAENLVTPIAVGACPDAEAIAAYADRNLAAEEATQYEDHFATCARCQNILALVALTAEETPQPVHELTPAQIAAQMAAQEAAQISFEMLAEVASQNNPQPREVFLRSIASSAPPSVSVPRTTLSAPTPVSSVHRAASPATQPQPTRWGWFVPAMAAAAAIALWFALRPTPPIQPLGSQLSAKNELSSAQPPAAGNNAQNNSPNNSEAAEPNIPSPPALPITSLSAPTPAAANGGASPRESRQLSADAFQPAAPAVAAQNPATQSEAASAPAARSESQEKLQTPRPSSDQPQAGKSPAAVVGGNGGASGGAGVLSAQAQAQATAPAAAPAPPPPPAPRATTDTVTVTGDLPASTEARAGIGGGAAGGAGVAGAFATPRALALSKTAVRLAVFASPSRAVLWRIGAGGSIERSTDQGNTWQPQPSGVTSDLIAGAAPSNEAAWIVGQAGVILRTTDGQRWQRVSSPFATAPSGIAQSATQSAAAQSSPAPSGPANTTPPDLIRIAAPDALHATVTATGNRRFTTTDGGQTWTQQ